MRTPGLVTVTATVKNTGEREGTEIVQCYVRNLGASLEQPVRSLKGFERVTLKPGESKQVTFKLGFRSFRSTTMTGTRWSSHGLHGMGGWKFDGGGA